jgi:hypothetical protein
VGSELDYENQHYVGNVRPFFPHQQDHLGKLAIVEHLDRGNELVELEQY